MYRKIPIDELEKYYIINRDGSILRRYDKSIIEFKENSYGYYQYYFKELKSVFLVHRIIISKTDYLVNLRVLLPAVAVKQKCLCRVLWRSGMERSLWLFSVFTVRKIHPAVWYGAYEILR